MRGFAELIEALGSLTETAEALGVAGPQAVWNMKARDSISAVHWPRLLRHCANKGVEHVSIETLVGWYGRRPDAAPRVAEVAA